MYLEVTAIGNLGSDPEMRYTESGVAVTNFSLATTKRIRKNDKPCPVGWKESYNGKHWELTTWIRVTAWRGLAETCNQYLEKGRTVFVKGELNGTAENGTQNPRVWTGNDGVARASFEITASTVKFVGGNKSSGENTNAPAVSEPPPGFVEENDIPF